VPTDADNQTVQVSTLTAKQIHTSSAATVQELLSTQAGVHTFNSTGAADQAQIDLRGFGIAGYSNTLILIDGVPQNNNELAPPMLGVVPLERIEKIEIVRGSGSVQYGGGTTGGVINILTKRGNPDNAPVSASVTGKIGSYGLNQVDASIGLQNEHISFDAYGQTLSNDNYRDNSHETRHLGGARLMFHHDGGNFGIYARTTHQRIGMPGPRKVDPATGENQYKDDPRGTSNPDDFIKTRNDAYGLQVEQAIGTGTLFAELSQRDKTLSGLAGSVVYGDTTREQRLNQATGSVRYQLPIGSKHALILGTDMLDSDLHATTQYSFTPTPDIWKASQRQFGLFAEAQMQATESTRLTLGGRRQYANDRLETVSGYSGNSDETRHLGAWQLGIKQNLSSNWSAYGKIGRSFRFANSDEMLFVTNSLSPQTSMDKELGLVWNTPLSNARLSWYRYDLTNEIQFNPITLANVNLDPTRREGIELEGNHLFSKRFSMMANVTWTQAEFRSGTANGVTLAGNTVPLVPRWMANIGATWFPTDKLFVNVTGQYVGKARMDNDQANQFDEQLDDYYLLNSKIGYAFTKHISGTLAVNNLLDKEYATYGIRSGSTGSSGAYFLYPASGRNVQASLTIRY